MQTVIDATQKETAIDQQQHSCETLICQRLQTILRLLSSAATASTRWRVRKLNCPTTYMVTCLHNLRFSGKYPYSSCLSLCMVIRWLLSRTYLFLCVFIRWPLYRTCLSFCIFIRWLLYRRSLCHCMVIRCPCTEHIYLWVWWLGDDPFYFRMIKR